jgi:uncharacterized membrane protein
LEIKSDTDEPLLFSPKERSHIMSALTTARRFAPPKLEALENRLVPSGRYDFGTIDDPLAQLNQGLLGTIAFGLNDTLQVVGRYADANIVLHGFLFSQRNFTSLDDPQAGAQGFQGTLALGIGPLGQIVGWYIDSNYVNHGFLLSGGQYTTLDDPNAGTGSYQGTYASGINASGQIVGVYFDANNVSHGFLLSGGQYTTFDDPDAGTGSFQATEGAGTNASGQIVGRYFDANFNTHGFLLSGGQYTTLDPPNADGFAQANGINDSGEIVGDYSDATGVHGYVLSGGQYTTLDDPNLAPGSFGSEVESVNNTGQIVGLFTDSTVTFHGYAANPVNHGASALFGNVLVVSQRAPFSNVEATPSAPASVPTAPSTFISTALVGSAVPQGQTASPIPTAGKADTAGKVVDQVFANFYDPLAIALSDDSTMV